jgi:CHAT domain-containing protein/tetratricopeptide (TPR) repeat protein
MESALAASGSPPRDTAAALVRLGQREESAGRFEAARDAESRAYALSSARGDRAGEADELAALGVVEDDLGLQESALRDDAKALALYRSLGDRTGMADALGNTGIAQMHVGRDDASLQSYRESLAIERAIGNRRGEAEELGRIGLIAEMRGRYDDALAQLGMALALASALHDVLGEAKARNNIGIVDEHLARYANALQMYRTALPLFRSVGYARGAAADLENIAIADADVGRYADALDVHRQALAAFRALGNRRGEAQDLANTGNVDEALGRYDDGLRALRDAIAIDRKIDNPLGIANVLGTLGAIEEDLGRHESALHAFQSALAAHRRLGSAIGEASDLGDIGIVAAELGNGAAALDAQERAFDLDSSIGNQRGEAEDITSVGGLEERARRPADAYAAYEKARSIDVAIGNRLGEAEDLGNIAVVEDGLDERNEALEAARRAIALERELGVPEALWRALRSAAHAAAQLDRPTEALAYYDEALDQIERIRSGLARSERRSFFADKLFVYDEYVDYLIELDGRFPGRGYDRKALEIFERRQARTFLELVAQSAVRNFAGVPAPIVGAERSLSLEDERLEAALITARSAAHPAYSGILALENDVARVARRRATLDATISARYPAFSMLLHPQPLLAESRDPARLTIASLQRDVLRPGEALLVYDVLADRTALWVVTPHALHLSVVPAGAAPLTANVAALRAYVEAIEPQISPAVSLRFVGRHAANAYGPVAAASAELYGRLIPPSIRPLIADATTLFVVPTGPLYGFPFETLVTQTAPEGPRPRYLVDERAISYLSSASLLAILRSGMERSSAPPMPLLAFADPDYDAPKVPPASDAGPIPGVAEQREAALSKTGIGFKSLPGTQDEARKIFTALGLAPASDTLHTGTDASVETLARLNRTGALADYRYVFFGAHAVMPDEVEGVTNSSLVLAHPPGGFLTMGDVFGLHLDARAVVLSACESGRGVVTAGEGVQGLTQAFMYAGTPVVSVTDWKVVDQIQPELSATFFKEMVAGRSAAAALRLAKLAMLESDDPSRSQPFFWAPTVIFGDGDAANSN